MMLARSVAPSGSRGTAKARLRHPSEVVLYVISGVKRPQGRCSAETWVSDALDFGFRVVYYSDRNASHQTRNGDLIPTRHVEDLGGLTGTRGKAWVAFAANILRDLVAFAPDARYLVRLDDDSFMNPYNFWRSLLALPEDREDWMIGDCGQDEHHMLWCGGGAGILMSRALAERLADQLQAGYDSVGVCALVGRQDDDTLGICAGKLNAKIMSHHGYHWWPPSNAARLPWWAPQAPTALTDLARWPWRWRFGDVSLDNCPAQLLGGFAVVQDWVTYHHLNCEQQRALSEARHTSGEPLRPRGDEVSRPPCAGILRGTFLETPNAEQRCRREASELSRAALCNF